MGTLIFQRPRAGRAHHYIISGLVLAAAFVAGVVITRRPKQPPPDIPATNATTRVTSTAPATKPALVVRNYMDLVRAMYPNFPATQPLVWPTSLEEAARLVIADPVHLERLSDRGDLWITRADGPPTADVLLGAADDQVHVTRETVAFAHWLPDEKNKWHPYLVCQKSDR